MNSSTHISHHEGFYDMHRRFGGEGNITEDTLSLSGFDIKNQTFGELKRTGSYFPYPGEGTWDGLLGLAPSSSRGSVS